MQFINFNNDNRATEFEEGVARLLTAVPGRITCREWVVEGLVITTSIQHPVSKCNILHMHTLALTLLYAHVCIGPFRAGQRWSIAMPMPSSPPKQTLDAFVPADGIICSHIVNLPLPRKAWACPLYP